MAVVKMGIIENSMRSLGVVCLVWIALVGCPSSSSAQATPPMTSVCDDKPVSARYTALCASLRGDVGNSNSDKGAAQRAQAAAAAAAEAQRHREAELKQQRIDADNKRRMEEIANQTSFIESRDAAARTLRDSSGNTISGESELRGSGVTTGSDSKDSMGLKVTRGTFGSNVAKPNLGGVSRDAAITNSAIQQGSSAAKSGKDAAAAESMERAKDLSNCQFDESGCRTPDVVSVPRHAGQQDNKPVPAALARALAKDSGYQKLEKQKAEQEKKYQELGSKLQEIRQQQSIGSGNQDALAVEAAKIKNEQTAVRSQEATIEIKMTDLSVAFQEETPAKKPSSSKSTPSSPQ
jgi:hypothetical protein